MQDECTKTIDSIKKQFLLNVPVNSFVWHNGFDLCESLQSELLRQTLGAETILRYPPNLNYQKAFLKHFIRGLEKKGTVIDGSCYEVYARLVATPAPQHYFKHYPIGDRTLVLQENVSFISDGTTGLVTWQAGLALAEWIIQNSSRFQDLNVLELGSGVGLAGLVLTTFARPRGVILSDCHPSVLQTLVTNVKLNHHLDEFHLEEPHTLENDCKLQISNVDWEHFDEEQCSRLGPSVDVILAADVIYDRSIFAPLIRTLALCFDRCGAKELILVCSERNRDTLAEFLRLLSDECFAVERSTLAEREFLWWPQDVPVVIYAITRSTSA